MGPMNWIAVILAALAAAAVWISGNRHEPRRRWALIALLLLLSAAMLGHSLARIGAITLAAKPKLYFMQSGGLAAAFVIPAVLIAQSKNGIGWQQSMRDGAVLLAAYLAMGAVFWLMA